MGNVGEKNVWTPKTTLHLDFHGECSCPEIGLKCVASYGDCRGKECMNITKTLSHDDDWYKELECDKENMFKCVFGLRYLSIFKAFQ